MLGSRAAAIIREFWDKTDAQEQLSKDGFLVSDMNPYHLSFDQERLLEIRDAVRTIRNWVAFFGILASTFLTLALALRVDHLWRLLRRAAGHDQREGVLARLFGATAIVALVVFAVWFLVIQGPLPSLAPA